VHKENLSGFANTRKTDTPNPKYGVLGNVKAGESCDKLNGEPGFCRYDLISLVFN